VLTTLCRSGGTIGSAQILQLSGVGPSSLMTSLGITSKLDLPVGYNLQDHVSYSMYWNTP
jgi:choline dehydrogenase